MTPKAKFYQVYDQLGASYAGLRLLEHLIAKRLIFGGPVLSGPRAFLWKNEIVGQTSCWTITFTREDLRDELIKERRRIGRGDLHDSVLTLRRKPGDASRSSRKLPRT